MIPTKNRVDFILRVLKYYSISKFKGKILIGDSSSETIFKRNSDSVSMFTSLLNIELYHDETLTADKMVSFLCKKVTTTYSLMHPDDDMIITSSLHHCINFLNENQNYSAVNGLAFNMGIDYNKYKAFGRVTLIKKYPLAQSLLSTPFKRIFEYFDNINNINMSVIRSKINLDAFSAIEALTDFDSSYVYGELVHASVVLSRGKVGLINHCYLVRQKHTSQFYRNQHFYNWVENSNPCNASTTLKKIIIRENNEEFNVKNSLILKEIDLFLFGIRKKITNNMASNLKNTSYLYRFKRLIFSILKDVFNKYKYILNNKIFSREIMVPVNSSINIDSLKLYMDVIEGKKSL